MNALALYHNLKKRGVALEAAGDSLKVDAPAGVLTDEDRAALLELKPILLRFLSCKAAPEEPESAYKDMPRSKARWAGPGSVKLFDPIEKVWHEVPSSMCLPGVIAEADAYRKRRKGGAARGPQRQASDERKERMIVTEANPMESRSE
ncbi:MAG: hypothetical protein WKF67_13645 [Rubrobacteraceae bacterium]